MIYFISYSHSQGFGRCEVVRKNPITSIDDIRHVEDLIMQTHREIAGVVVLTFQLFPEEKK